MKDLKKQFDELKMIEPEREWKKNVKNEILGPRKAFSFDFLPQFDFKNVPTRVLWAAPAGVFLVVFSIFFYNQYFRYPVEVEEDLTRLQLVSERLREEKMEIAERTTLITSTYEPRELLEASVEIEKTLEKARAISEVTEEIARKSSEGEESSKESLAMRQAAQEVEEEAEKMKETYLNRQKEMAELLIADLEEASLSEEQSRSLKEAKVLYNEGRFDQAIETCLQTGQSE